jgi:hypothetical protein
MIGLRSSFGQRIGQVLLKQVARIPLALASAASPEAQLAARRKDAAYSIQGNQFTDGSPFPTPGTAGTAAAPAANAIPVAPRWPRPTGPSALAAVSFLSRRAMAAYSPQPTRAA